MAWTTVSAANTWEEEAGFVLVPKAVSGKNDGRASVEDEMEVP